MDRNTVRSYSVTGRPYNFGVFGSPYINDGNLDGRRIGRVEKDKTELDPIQMKPPVLARKPVGNEHELGPDVFNLINEESNKEIQKQDIWYSQIGVMSMADGVACVRPRSSFDGLRRNCRDIFIADRRYNIGYDLFEAVPLEGSQGVLATSARLRYGDTEHPIRQICSNFDLGYSLLVEDYKCTSLSRDDSHRRISMVNSRSLPLTRFSSVCPYETAFAVTFDDGDIRILDESLETRYQIKDLNAQQVYFGGRRELLLVSSGEWYGMYDCRGKTSRDIHGDTIQLHSNISPLDAEGVRFLCAGKDNLSMYDLRMLGKSVLEMSNTFLGISECTWMDWLGKDLIIYNRSPVSRLTKVTGLSIGQRPLLDTVTIQKDCHGLTIGGDYLYILHENLYMSALSSTDFYDTEIVGEGLGTKPEEIPGESIPSMDNEISDIYVSHYSYPEPQTLKSQGLMELSQPAKILDAQWILRKGEKFNVTSEEDETGE